MPTPSKKQMVMAICCALFNKPDIPEDNWKFRKAMRQTNEDLQPSYEIALRVIAENSKRDPKTWANWMLTLGGFEAAR